jgi:hypothetical protein
VYATVLFEVFAPIGHVENEAFGIARRGELFVQGHVSARDSDYA